MDYIFLNFSDYLSRIGFLNNSNIQDFGKIFYSLNLQTENTTLTNSSDKYLDSSLIKDKVSSCIVEFLNLLNNDRKKLLGLSLFSKFCEINTEQKIDNAKFLLTKYKTLKLIPYFWKWKKNILSNKNNISILFQSHTNNINSTRISNNNIINSSFNDLTINKNNINSVIKNQKNLSTDSLSIKKQKQKEKTLTLSSKEQEELKECTFKPKINNYNPFTNNSQITTSSKSKGINKQIIDKLYLDNKRRNDKRNLELQAKNKRDAKENTFQPLLISKTPKNINNNFEERLKSFDNQKNTNLEKLRENYENNFTNLCTFSPNISKSQKSVSRSFSSEKLINLPIHERLYKNGEEQKRKKMLKEKEFNLQIKNSANFLLNRNNDNLNNKFNSVDYKKIEELHNDYKKMKNKLSKKRADLDIEQGITFQPEIYTNRKYYDKIDDDFNKREQYYLDKKLVNLQNYQNIIDEQNNSISSRKKYTKKEKEEIANNIINRLYKEGVQKYKNRKNSLDIYERENKGFTEKNFHYDNYLSNQQDNFS